MSGNTVVSGPAAPPSNAEIRAVARGLTDARDAQILRVVAMVDAMPDRGAADLLIAPLRPKLARLRPPRPLRLARLMFLPLDPLIVPAPRWRPDEPSIPRTVIPFFAAWVTAAMEELATEVAALIEGKTTRDLGAIDAAGAILWKAAAACLLNVPPVTPEWRATGLAPRYHQILARKIAALLFQAERLQRLTTDAAEGLAADTTLIQPILVEATRCEPEVQPMLIALLLARVPEAGPVLARLVAALGARAESSLRAAGDQAADMLLDQLEAPGGAEGPLGGPDLTETAAAVRRVTTLLSSLDGDATPARRERVAGMRERIRRGCEAMFTERLSTDLLDPIRTQILASDPDLEWELETAARGLRALETEARRIGGGRTYDTLLSNAAEVVKEATVAGGLGQAGGPRLIEILAGPAVALALLGVEN